MRIDVTGKGVEVTAALKQYAEGKASKLQKFERVQQIRMTLQKKKVDHHDSFEAELVLDVERHDDFVSHAGADDLYAAIDLVVDKGERQLRDWKDQVKQKH
jgi:putative sigma-54 modulation protein